MGYMSLSDKARVDGRTKARQHIEMSCLHRVVTLEEMASERFDEEANSTHNKTVRTIWIKEWVGGYLREYWEAALPSLQITWGK